MSELQKKTRKTNLKTRDRKNNSTEAKNKASRAASQPLNSLSPAESVINMQQTYGNQAVLQNLPQPEGEGQVDASTSQTIMKAQGTGSLLPPHFRRQMEQTLHRDFSQVHLHTDDSADKLNKRMGASAFTVGKDIFFRHGAYQPDSFKGNEILRHELAHVVQQKGQASSQLRLGKIDDAHEREAHQFSRNPSSGVSTSSAGTIQRDVHHPWMEEALKPAPTLSAAKKVTSLGGGSANPVYLAEHADKSKGYLKPETGRNSAARSVVSSRLDKLLGTRALSTESYADYGEGLRGSESSAVPGKPVSENEFKTKASDEEVNEVSMGGHMEMLDPARYKVTPKGVFKKSATKYNRHDFMHPETQRSLSNIQLQDAITGQADRHSGNIKIDPKTHTAMGYDNDDVDFVHTGDTDALSRIQGLSKSATGEVPANREGAREAALKSVNKQFGKHVGLPSHIDAETAKSMLKLKSSQMIADLKEGGSQGGLSDEQLEELRLRYSSVRRYVKAGMAKAGGNVEGIAPEKMAKWGSDAYQRTVMRGTGGKIPNIVERGNWDRSTYDAQMTAPTLHGQTSSYLQRSVRDYNAALPLKKSSGNYSEKGKAFPEPAAVPAWGTRITASHGAARGAPLLNRVPPPPPQVHVEAQTHRGGQFNAEQLRAAFAAEHQQVQAPPPARALPKPPPRTLPRPPLQTAHPVSLTAPSSEPSASVASPDTAQKKSVKDLIAQFS
jgi:hypothetical protein